MIKQTHWNVKSNNFKLAEWNQTEFSENWELAFTVEKLWIHLYVSYKKATNDTKPVEFYPILLHSCPNAKVLSYKSPWEIIILQRVHFFPENITPNQSPFFMCAIKWPNWDHYGHSVSETVWDISREQKSLCYSYEKCESMTGREKRMKW